LQVGSWLRKKGDQGEGGRETAIGGDGIFVKAWSRHTVEGREAEKKRDVTDEQRG